MLCWIYSPECELLTTAASTGILHERLANPVASRHLDCVLEASEGCTESICLESAHSVCVYVKNVVITSEIP